MCIYIRIKETQKCNKSLKMTCRLSPYQTLALLLLLAISSLAARECPTWFKEAEDGTCKCGSDLGRVIKCNNSTKRVSIIANNCMTYDNRTNSVVVGTCLTIYLNSTLSAKTAYFTLPQDVSNLSLLCNIAKQQVFCVVSAWMDMAGQLTPYSLGVQSVIGPWQVFT